MSTVLLAIGMQGAEEKIAETMQDRKDEFNIVGTVSHKDALVEFLDNTEVDILVYREGLQNVEKDFSFVISLKTKYPKTRIVFIPNGRKPGDKNLVLLVTYAIYDILVGDRVSVASIVKLIYKANTLNDALVFLPRNLEEDGLFSEEELRNINSTESTSSLDTREVVEIIENNEDEAKTPTKKGTLKDRIAAKNKQEKEAGATQMSPAEINEIQDKLNAYKQVNDELLKAKKEAELNKANAEQLKAEKEKLQKEKEEIEKRAKEEAAAYKKQQEELQNDAIKEKAKYERELERLIKENEKQKGLSSIQKIITFYGAMPGVGNTTIAFDVATYLALKGKKVIYIEQNTVIPTIRYIYEMSDELGSIEKTFIGIETRNYQDLDANIITQQKLIDTNPEFEDKYKKMPKMDFLLYSENSINSGREIVPNTLKDLLLSLLYKNMYDYIIFDMYSLTNFNIIETSVMFSSLNIFTMTQELTTVANTIKVLEQLKTSNGEMPVNQKDKYSNNNPKNVFIVNKYNNKIALKTKEICEWLEVPSVFTVPDNYVEIVNANYRAIPPLLASKNKDYLLAIKNIISKIEERSNSSDEK